MNAPVAGDGMSSDQSLAVMAVEIRYIKDAVERMERSNAASVTRNEWEQRNQYVDGRLTELAKELAARRMPWPSIGALIVAAAVLLIDLIPRIAN